MINNQPFKRKREKKYYHKIIDFIWDEMNKWSINHYGEYVAGWQRVSWMTKDQILRQPFEAAKELTSTRGRILVLQNWEKLIRHPDFIYQSSLERWIGFSVSWSTKYNGKCEIY